MGRRDGLGVDALQREEGEDEGRRGDLVDEAAHQVVGRRQDEVVQAEQARVQTV